MQNFSLAEEALGYVTSQDPSNTDFRFLVGGSKNVLINSQKKIYSRPGYTRLGAGNPAIYAVRNGWDWQTSTGVRRSYRFYNDTLETYLEDVDGVAVDAWTKVRGSFSTTKILRSCIQQGGNGGWFDSVEKIDICLMVNGDAHIYETNGAFAIINSVTSSTITKKGTTTFGQNRFYSNRVTIGDTTTQFDITNPSGTTFRYTYDTTGTNPNISATTFPIGIAVSIQAQNFDPSNKGTFLVTGSGANYFEVNNLAGTAESNKTIGTGNIDIKSVAVCVRTGAEYAYTGGESTTTLTGVNDTTGLIAGDILVQKVYVTNNKPTTNYTNDVIYNFENQIIISSENSDVVYGSKNTDYTSYTPSSPRQPGEGFNLTLDNPTRGITSLGKNLLMGAGPSTIFKANFSLLTVSATVVETVNIERLNVGVNQGFLGHESIVAVGNSIFFLSNEVALRSIDNPNNLTGLNPKTLSNPIKPDFDAEDWSGTPFGTWYKNILLFSAPAASHTYMLNFVEDADGKLFRFWNPPQVLPVGPFAQIELDGVQQLYAHSNAVPETNLLFDGGSDGQYNGMPVEDKLPIEAIAIRAYNNYKKKGSLKNFDEFFSVGEITASTVDLNVILRYDYGGMTQTVTETIDGSDEAILEGVVGINSLAQSSLATNPLGGLLYPPSNARRFRVIFEEAKEDFFELQIEYYSNDVDRYWAILADGINVQLSRRRSTTIKM